MEWGGDWLPDEEYFPYLKRRIQNGRGRGHRDKYSPRIHIRDIPSQGTSHAPTSLLGMDREHHFISDLEYTAFMDVERRVDTSDIREQYPILDVAGTLELCSKLGTRHNYRDGFPEPFTFDLLVTLRTEAGTKYRALSVKSVEDAQNPDVRRRLLVEREWAQQRGIDWRLVASSLLSQQALKTMEYLRGWPATGMRITDKASQAFATTFLNLYSHNIILAELLRSCNKVKHYKDGEALTYFRHAAWRGYIPVSYQRRIALNEPVFLRP